MTSNEMNIVSVDHCYSKPWSSHPDASNARPIHMLFMKKFPHISTQEKQRSTDIDIVGDDNNRSAICDPGKARAGFSDYDAIQPDYINSRDEWEDNIAEVRTTWSVSQNRIFAKVMKVLQSDRLARLSVQGTKNETIQRRFQIDKATKQVRFSFGSVGLDMTLILWLHNLLLENLTGHLLTSYLEILATLKSKIPSLVEKLIQGAGSKQSFAMEHLIGLLKRNWDPVLSCINHHKLKKLPESPLLLFIPDAPTSFLNPVAVKRQKFWQHQLSAMGKVINIAPVCNTTHMSITSCVENWITTTRSKLLEIKGHFPGRPVILIGWHVGALVAINIAILETVHAIVCLGFPTMGIYGNRGDIDDQIYACKTPTLFVVGQHASSCSVDVLEDLREKLRAETGLVLVGGADDQLKMTRVKKHSCGLTQAMVDRCIMDEMFEFLGSILSQNMTQSETSEDTEIKKDRKRKQKYDTSITGSQTGNLSVQTSMRTIRALKIGSKGTFSYGTQCSVAGGTKMVKRLSAKRHATSTEGNSISSKKHVVHLNFSVKDSSDNPSPSHLKVNEAAAIASAPELSSLLQNMQTTEQQVMVPDSSSLVNKSVITSSCLTTVATTTALSLTQFLATSGIFKTNASVKTKEYTSDESTIGTLTSSTEKQPYTDKPCIKQQPQIFVQAGTSSIPFSIPLAFSIGSKVLQSSPQMRSSCSITDSSHIQLLTSVPTTAVPSRVTPPATAVSFCSNAVQPLSNTLSPISLVPPTAISLSSTLSTRILSPGSSVINIDSDATFVTETPSSTSLVPGTVSIDLGQISLGTSNVRKLTATPKISLIPTAKQISVSGLTEKLLMTAAQSAVTTISSLPHSLLGKPSSTASNHSVLGNTNSLKTCDSTVAPSLKTMSSPQLLSTLTSSTGMIALKFPTQSTSGGLSPLRMMVGKDDTFLAHVNLDGKKSMSLSSSIEPNTTSISKIAATEHQQQNLQVVTPTVSVPSQASLVVTSENKFEVGQILFQHQKDASNYSQSYMMKSDSVLPCVSSASEVIGTVPSFIESSPLSVTHDSDNFVTEGKQTNKELSSVSSLSSFCSPSSNMKNKTNASYTATTKPILPTIASTRTRRIRTPKQYDL